MEFIKSHLITNASASLKRDYKNVELYGFPADISLRYMVFRTIVGKKTVYCCWVGGELMNGEVMLTPIGQAAFDVLVNLPCVEKGVLIFQELKLGRIPVKAKVKKALKKAPRNSCICFFGDISGDLDGEMHNSLNLIGNVEI